MSTAAAPRIGSLCSGYGGLDMAVEAVFGGRTMWHCEIEDAPSKILAAHWDVPNHRDLKSVDWSTVEPVDIMTAGFPCQPFSHAGRRLGEADERHLWPYIVHAIMALRPSTIVLENVSGLRTIGGTYVEPTDRCLCGWPAGRGGLRGAVEVQDDVRGAAGLRDDGQGSTDAGEDAARVRRHDLSVSAGDREVGGRDPVEPVWSDRRGVSPQGPAVSDDEERAGTAGAPGGADSPGIAEDAHRAESVDTGGVRPLHDDLRPNQGTESEGATVDRRPDARADSVCPACGRQLAKYAERSVFRSGFGIVLGDLAALGYDPSWVCLRAADVGAPHGRERIFILATDTHHAGSQGRESAGRRIMSDGCSAADTFRRRWDGRAHEPFGGSEGRTAAARAGNDAAADATGERRGEGWPESARLERGSDAPLSGDPATPDASGSRLAQHPGEPSTQETRADGGYVAASDRGPRAATDWGPYRPAVERWERATGRVAPAPTELAPRGGQRLSPRFVEWMMGLPAGWVTDVPISRNEQLKALGNGVVPQQAIEALRRLLPIATEAAA